MTNDEVMALYESCKTDDPTRCFSDRVLQAMRHIAQQSDVDGKRLIGLAAELANENERLRNALRALLNDKGSVQYPEHHERVVNARKALKVAAVPLSDLTNEMRRAAWEKYTSANVPYSAIYAVMAKASPSNSERPS